MSQRLDRLKDELATAFCKHFCQDHCKASPTNDQCWCTEAGIVGAEAIEKLVSYGYCASPSDKEHIRLVKSDTIEKTPTTVG